MREGKLLYNIVKGKDPIQKFIHYYKSKNQPLVRNITGEVNGKVFFVSGEIKYDVTVTVTEPILFYNQEAVEIREDIKRVGKYYDIEFFEIEVRPIFKYRFLLFFTKNPHLCLFSSSFFGWLIFQYTKNLHISALTFVFSFIGTMFLLASLHRKHFSKKLSIKVDI